MNRKFTGPSIFFLVILVLYEGCSILAQFEGGANRQPILLRGVVVVVLLGLALMNLGTSRKRKQRDKS